jgi:poly-beta-1,6-N-acetyl-D-glucosamine synthase
MLQQRMRWASKTKQYHEKYIRNTGILILVTNFGLLCALLLFLTGAFNIFQLILIWVIKGSADFILMNALTKFTNQRRLLFLFLPFLVLYPFYLTMVLMVVSFGKSYTWKNRLHSIYKNNAA